MLTLWHTHMSSHSARRVLSAILSTLALFANFIQRPLPAGSTTGAVVGQTGQAGEANTCFFFFRTSVEMRISRLISHYCYISISTGALGLGLQTATALTTLFTFLVYCIP